MNMGFNNSCCSIIRILIISLLYNEEMVISELVRIHVLKEYLGGGGRPPQFHGRKTWEAFGEVETVLSEVLELLLLVSI